MKSKRASRISSLTWAVLVALNFFGGRADAAEISCAAKWGLFAKDAEAFPSGRRLSSDACYTLLVEGEVASGDADKFAELLRLYHPFVDRVLLASPGGLVEEALKIGKLVRTAMLITEAPLGWGKNGEGRRVPVRQWHLQIPRELQKVFRAHS